MHHHQLVFTTEVAATLQKEYDTLLHKLGLGKKLQPEYLAALTVSMREVLYTQEGLTTFWQQAQEKPQESYHLHLTHTDKALLNLPWQMAIDEEAYPFMYVSKGSPGMESQPVYEPKEGPLRILVMISSPADQDARRRLSYEEEEDAILKALAPLWEKGQVQVSFTSNGSLHSLEQQLATQYYHVLYFSGHGVYKYHTGYLLLEDKKTSVREEVTAEQFAKSLAKKRAHIPALVILACCQSAAGDAEQGLPGVADELMAIGVPAVIAMAFSIADQYATVFAAQLHEQLAQREELLSAYSKALRAMEEVEAQFAADHDYDYAPTQWLIPQLYYHKPVKHIVDWQRMQPTVRPVLPPWGTAGTAILLQEAPHYRFIGRRPESARLLQALHLNNAVLLRGQAGVGKTALAEHVARRLMAYDTAFHVFAFDATTISLSEMISRLEQYLEKQAVAVNRPSGKSGPEQLTYLLERVSQLCRPVWIFDQIDACQQRPGGPLQADRQPWMDFTQAYLLQKHPVIFTCRYRVPELTAVFDMPVHEAMPADLYRKLQQLTVGSIQRQYPDSELIEVAEILYNALGGNYRAWQLFDKLYKKDTKAMGRMLEKIWREEDPTRSIHLYDKITRDVQALLDAANKKPLFEAVRSLLSDAAWQALLLLANFRGAVPVTALEMQKPGEAWKPALQELHDLALIEGYQLPDSKRSPRHFCVTRLVKEWLKKQGVKAVIPFSDETAGDYFFELGQESNSHLDYVEAFWHYLPTRHVDKINYTGAWLSNEYFQMGMPDKALQYGLHTLQIAGEKTNGYVLHVIGLVYRAQGNMEEALRFQEACLQAARDNKDRVQEGHALYILGIQMQDTSNNDDAIALITESIKIAEESGHQADAAARMNNLGRIFGLQREYGAAVELFEKSLQIYQGLEDLHGAAVTMLYIAEVYEVLGEHTTAIEHLKFCQEVFKEGDDKEELGMVLNTLGSIYSTMGEYERAWDYLERALTLQLAIRNKYGEARALHNIATLCIEMEHYEEAFPYLERSLSLFEVHGTRNEEGDAWNDLSGLYRKTGQPQQAIEMAEKGLAVHKEIGDLTGQSMSLFHIAMAYENLDNTRKSKRYFKESKALLEQLGPAADMDQLHTIDRMLTPERNKNKTLELLEKNLAAYRKTGNRASEAGILHEMAEVAAASADADRFFEWETESYRIYSEIGHRQGIFLSGSNLGYVLYVNPDPESRAQGLDLLQYCFRIGKEEGYPEAQEIADFIRKYDGIHDKKT